MIVESILASAVSDADIVLEAVVEDIQIKNGLFRGKQLAKTYVLMSKEVNIVLYIIVRY